MGAAGGDWSVERVREVIAGSAATWRGEGLKLFTELRFTYEVGNPKPNPQPETRNPKPCILNPKSVRGGAAGGSLRALRVEPRVPAHPKP